MQTEAIDRRSFLKKVVAVSATLTTVTIAGDQLLVPRVEAQPKDHDHELETVRYTFCDGCNEVPFCGMKYYTKGNIVTRIENWEGYPASPICSKGYATLQRLYHPKRLRYPMKRTTPKGSDDPGFVRISWDEAYSIIVDKLKEIKEKYGPEYVFFYCGDPKEPRAAVMRLASLYGSPNYGCESSTACRRAAMLAEVITYGFPTMGNPPSPETKACLIWGANPPWSCQPGGPGIAKKLLDAKNRGVKFIVVDPRKTPTARLANIHLQLRPATDAALALGMMNVIINEKLYDEEFCSKWTSGFDELKEYVQNFPPEKVEEITWVPAKKIVDAARLYAINKPGTFIASAQGTTHNTNAVQNHRAILVLVAICGNLDIPGGVNVPTYPLLGMVGPWGMGPPGFTLGMRNPNRDKRLDTQDFPVWSKLIWEVQTNKLPEWVREGKIKALLAWGLNVMIWPQTHEYQEALKKIEFVMAVDYFYRPWTHNYVDILLPAATNFERMAPFAVFGRKLFWRDPLPPQGECKEDWAIALEIGTRLGYGDLCFNGDVEAALNSILAMWNVTSDDLRRNQESGLLIPPPGPEQYKKYELGLLRPDKKPGFNTPSGKIEITSTILKDAGFDPLPVYKPPREPTADHPLILITGSRVPFITHSKWRTDSPWLYELMPEPVVNINPKDAADRGIEEGDEVIIESPHGSIKAKAHITNIVPPRVVDIMHGWANANVNELIPREFDPISGFPPYKEGLCEVRKA